MCHREGLRLDFLAFLFDVDLDKLASFGGGGVPSIALTVSSKASGMCRAFNGAWSRFAIYLVPLAGSSAAWPYLFLARSVSGSST